jgi:hypothetical protein
LLCKFPPKQPSLPDTRSRSQDVCKNALSPTFAATDFNQNLTYYGASMAQSVKGSDSHQGQESRSGAHSACYSVATGDPPRSSSGRGMKLTTHLHPVLRLRMSGAIPLLLLHAFTASTAIRTRSSNSYTQRECGRGRGHEPKGPYSFLNISLRQRTHNRSSYIAQVSSDLRRSSVVTFKTKQNA